MKANSAAARKVMASASFAVITMILMMPLHNASAASKVTPDSILSSVDDQYMSPSVGSKVWNEKTKKLDQQYTNMSALKVTANTIGEMLEVNEFSVNQKYSYSGVLISGVVGRVATTLGDKPVAVLVNDKGRAVVGLTPRTKAYEDVAKFKKGDVVVMMCFGEGNISQGIFRKDDCLMPQKKK